MSGESPVEGAGIAGFSPAQRRVVTYPPDAGHLLVLAGPGAGKTMTLVDRISRLLSEGHCRAEQVLAMTFATQPAGELRGRLAVRGHAGVTTGTFHHVCARLLTEHGRSVGVEPPLRIHDERRQEEVLHRAAHQIGWPLERGGTPPVSTLIEHVGRRKLAGLAPGSWPPGRPREPERYAEQIEALDERYDRVLRELGGLDYADLIVLGQRLLREDGGVRQLVRRRFRFVFVDEFHDLSPDQWRLLTLIAPPVVERVHPDDGSADGPSQVMVVADPEQGIYGFRDANPAAMLAAYRREYRPTPFNLTDNFRSTATIVRLASALRPSRAAGPPLHPVAPEGVPVVCVGFPDERSEADGLVGLIRRAREVGGYALDEIAILYRTNRRSELAEAAILRAGLPIRRFQRDRFFDQPDVQESLRYLDLVASLTSRSFEPALNWPRVLVDELTMVHLRRIARARGMTLAELAEHSSGLAEISPLTQAAIEDLRGGVVAELRPLVEGRLAPLVEALLALLARRRSPFPKAERETLRGFSEFLGLSLHGAAELLRAAVDAGRPVVLVHRGDVDTVAAAAILERALLRYLRHPVVAQPSSESIPDGALTIALGEAKRVAGEGVVLAPLATRQVTYSVATLAWRLGQRLLMGYERLDRGRFAVYDLETGSDHAGTTEPLEVAALRLDGGEIRNERFASLLRPSSAAAITWEAEQLHGIGWRDVRDAPTAAEIVPELLAFFGEDTLVGHNIVEFDGRVLGRLCDELGLSPPTDLIVDTCALARRLLPDETHGLEALARRFRLAERQVHRAGPDCVLVAGVFRELLALERAERELDVLSETLPLVALGIQAIGAPRDETATLVLAGARGVAFGQGAEPLARFRSLLADPALAEAALANLRAVEHAVPDDEGWETFGRRWRTAVSAYLAAGGAPTLAAFLEYAALASPLDEGADAPSRLTMSTIHSAKGKEWPLVFLIGLEDGVLPDYRSLDDPALLAEERRALYVGVTRARRQVCLLWAAESSGHDRSPCRFLGALPAGLIEHRSRSFRV